jgi:pyruvate dehydrogenase E1 component
VAELVDKLLERAGLLQRVEIFAVDAVPDQVARWVPRPFVSLGTDGFGRSDTRAALRRFFEVDAAHVVVAVLSALAQSGDAKADEVAEAIAAYGIDPDATDPWAD